MRRAIRPARERLVTAEEFARIPNDDYHYELVAGRVVRVSPPGSRHALLAVHRPHSSPVRLDVDDVLDAGDVVPCFACPIGRIFD